MYCDSDNMKTLNPHSLALTNCNNPVTTGSPLLLGGVFFMEEIWMNFDVDPCYEISNMGLLRNKTTKNVLRPYTMKSGYLVVRKQGYFAKTIHRQVALHFIPNPENKPTVNHIDGNKNNNTVNNLEWCTHKENSNHAWRIGLMENSRKRASERMSIMSTNKSVENGNRLISYTKSRMGKNVTCPKCGKTMGELGYASHKLTHLRGD